MNRNTAKWMAAFAAGVGTGLAVTTALQNQNRLDLHGRVVVITGGSRGLGLVLARHFAREGARLALLARDEAQLNRAAADLLTQGIEVVAVPCDIRNQAEVDGAVDHIAQRFGRIDVLINNAGVIQVGPLEHMTVDDFRESLDVHLFGPLYMTLAALPHMTARDGGRIVNISSIGGKVAMPHLLPYTAGKFALTGLSDGLRAELRRRNILVTTVCPGLMRTGSIFNALFKGQHHREFAWFAVSDSLPLVSIDADRAAEKILDACRRGDARLIITPQAKAAVLFNEILPGPVAALSSLANRLLPSSDPDCSTERHTGWQSQSRWAPSWLTRLSDRAATENNERPAVDPATPPSRT